MKLKYITKQSGLIALLFLISPILWAFDSGSTGVDGALNVIVDTNIQLPPDGVLNYTTVTIATGQTLTFTKNTTNTPVVILASGDVTIAGTIDISGTRAANIGTNGDGNIGDDGLPGISGPGGFDGGRGGAQSPGAAALAPERAGGHGLGPGGGEPGMRSLETNIEWGCGGAGASFATTGQSGDHGNAGTCDGSGAYASTGPVYGTDSLLPLIGGSGGGGGAGGYNFSGSGGGGGGGAILIASSGIVNITGSILANGGDSGNYGGTQVGGAGGGGSGGAIRIVATEIEGNGTLQASKGLERGNTTTCNTCEGGDGGDGRIKLEAEIFQFTGSTTPAQVFTVPNDIFVAGMPTLTITTVAGVTAPANPTGNADIVLADTVTNPVTVDFATTNVPLGNTVELTLTPAFGDISTATSPAIAGTEANGTASVDIDIPDGANVLTAEVSFTVVADAVNYEDYSRYADGEPVERVILRAGVGPQMASTTKGTLRIGDVVLCGTAFGRIRAMYDDHDNELQEAPPSTPVKVAGLDSVPGAGNHFFVMSEVEEAREISESRHHLGRTKTLSGKGKPRTLEDILVAARGGSVQELPLIIKADTPGSIEALRGEIEKFEHPEVRVTIVHDGVGGVNESDVYLASASGAIIIAFHVIPEDRAAALAEREGVDVRRFNIIYEVTETIKRSLEGLLEPERVEVPTGRALVLQTFSISRFGTIAGCRVLSGTISRGNRVHVIRDQTVLNDYDIASLKREKDDAKEVRDGMECGIRLDGFNDVKEGDLLESFRVDQVKRTLD